MQAPAILNVQSRECVGRGAAYVAIALSSGFGTAFALDWLGVLAELPGLRSAVAAPLAVAFWSYLALTPIAAMSVHQQRLSNIALTRVVHALSALWLLSVVGLLLLPFFAGI